MYDFYPEWGPARNRDEDEAPPARRTARHSARYWTNDRHDRGPAMVGAARAETRDGEGARPDDN
jgi:hypothetical protein